MAKKQAVESQYDVCLRLEETQGLATMGLMTNWAWHDDPKRLAFTLSRYKFVAKMFSGMDRVLEVGCADAFGTRIVVQEVKRLTAVDFDPIFVADANRRMVPRWTFDCRVHDVSRGPVPGLFDGVYALDVLEHIPQKSEDRFIESLCGSLGKHGTLLLGTPSLESQPYASASSKAGHINCKTQPQLRKLVSSHFHNVFMFSMNDEVVHTGYSQMSHYLWALACSKK